MVRKKRLLWQLYPSFLLITVLALLAVTWDAWYSLRETYLKQTEADLTVRAQLVRRQIRDPLAAGAYSAVDALCKAEGRETSTRLTVILPDGTVVADSVERPEVMENHRKRPEVGRALTTGTGVATHYSRTLRAEMMYVAIPVTARDEPIGVVRTALPLTSIDQILRVATTKLLTGLLVIAVLAALASLYLSRRIGEPLEEMRRTAARFARGDLSERLQPQETEEFSEVAQAMNHMAAQLDERIRTALRERNEQEAMLSSMAEGMLAIDKDERIIKLNHAAARLLGIDPSSAQGHSLQEGIRHSDLQQFALRVLASDTMLEDEIVLRSHGEHFMQLHGSPLRDEYGRRVGALVVMNDMTHLRRLETVRRDFVANVSHELRTPITSIKGFVETLLDGTEFAPEDTRRFLEIIARHTDRLNSIIEDLLSLSRLEQQADTDGITRVTAPLRPVLNAAMQNCELKAREKRIRIALQCDDHLQGYINAPLLEQAVTNLIDNAIKYSDEGSSVFVSAEQDGDGSHIRVRDEGCGIEREHLSRLFERFYRVDTGRSRKLGGTGLGLSIVKHIAQAHKGRVSIDSTPGKGSTFSLYLPGAPE